MPWSSENENRAERNRLCPRVCWWESTRRRRRDWSARGEGCSALEEEEEEEEGVTSHQRPAGEREGEREGGRGRREREEGEGGGRGRTEREEGEGGGREVERGEGGEGERGGGKYRRCETREVKKTERMVVHGVGRGKVKQEVGRGKRWEGEEVEVGRTASNISQVMDERMRVWRV